VIFRQLFEPLSSTYAYVLGREGTGEAVLIDPVLNHIAVGQDDRRSKLACVRQRIE
jgi:glyoxylase-like metal-dependent hydrolase (beta-lactamase superfamily II)